MLAQTKAKVGKVTQRLIEQFYFDGAVISDGNASSHWKHFSKNISIDITKEKAEFIGFGFGESGQLGFLRGLYAWVSILLHLRKLSDARLSQYVKRARSIVKKMGLCFSFDAFRQAATLNFLAGHFERNVIPGRILVIGDGHGILSALIHAEYPQSQIILVDLGAVLLFQSHYLHEAFPEALQSHIEEGAEKCHGSSFIFCPSGDLELLSLEIDLAINVASMQEMNPLTIANYFIFLRKSKTKLFYCCNRLEKFLVGGEVTRFMEYPWRFLDVHIVDELTPWHQWFFAIGGSSSNVKCRGMPVPFIHQYDGPHWHRLTRLQAL
jgi:hypothetical protein